MIKKIVSYLNKNNIKHIITYLIVGFSNTAIILAAYYIALLIFGFNFIGASLFSTVIGIPIGFKAHGKLVFKNKGLFWRYVLNFGFNFLINTLLIAWVAVYVGPAWAPIVLLPITTVSSYLLMKYFVFVK